MSSAAAADATQAPNPALANANTATSKKKNNKKKKNANKNKDNAPADSGKPQNGHDEADDNDDDEQEQSHDEATNKAINGHAINSAKNNNSIIDPKAQGALQAEVDQLRKQLEALQQTHKTEIERLQTELEESNTAKETAEEQYQTLLERVEKIKETLSDRLRRDKAELEEAKERIEELESQNEQLENSASSSDKDHQKLRQELQDANRELTTLRSRSNLSTQNWNKEREDLTRAMQRLKEEMETTANAMGEWEVIAMEERSVKESLGDKIAELEEQAAALRQGYESAASERDSQSTLIDNLQNALREIQDARKKELRDMVESTEAQLQAQKRLAAEAEARAAEAQDAKEALTKEVERTAPFEKEVKEKNLLIGKLRHEAIVLNDHLTKALRYLKKTKPEENVDRQVVTNHLLHFLTLDRGDVKRFQVLQIMAGYLNWTDEQREQAGLSRPGGSGGGSLRLPTSPFHRTPSSPSLHNDLLSEPTSAKDRESLAELWAGFLERSAKEGLPDGGVDARSASSRKTSVSSAATGTTATTEKKP
ncbi:Golgi matrix protein [Cordyceps fumosorosea ARSEF 2679]|uniref:Golgi matrix protein n=1 Tax=Cordyceps fumosorosea (strain ARSEF 2679) TaxID=1081104 RepID=A0A162N172_CORFA|nr:Golgi matrix protein [Cordyceps fumosorosea ARSEF 2679]OAA73869.1 Golgi matrix protein [Cordyceps fumosorosea ARSEF 2679]